MDQQNIDESLFKLCSLPSKKSDFINTIEKIVEKGANPTAPQKKGRNGITNSFLRIISESDEDVAMMIIPIFIKSPKVSKNKYY